MMYVYVNVEWKFPDVASLFAECLLHPIREAQTLYRMPFRACYHINIKAQYKGMPFKMLWKTSSWPHYGLRRGAQDWQLHAAPHLSRHRHPAAGAQAASINHAESLAVYALCRKWFRTWVHRGKPQGLRERE